MAPKKKKASKKAQSAYIDAGAQGDSGASVESDDDFSPDEATSKCGTWLECTNYHRASAGIAPISEDRSLQEGVTNHAKYMVQNKEVTHYEKVGKTGYTASGEKAGKKSNVTGSNVQWEARDAIDSWLQAPFHALNMLSPRLARSAYGQYYADDGSQRMVFAAALNTSDGIDRSRVHEYPFVWPGDRTTVALSYYYGENPDPLTSCPGYKAPAGVPLLAMLGDGSSAVGTVEHSLTLDGVPVEHCEIDEANYSHPSADAQKIGRDILKSRSAVLIVAKEPLAPGGTYAVSVKGSGVSVDWTFRVSATPREYPGIPIEALRRHNR
ncbi:MAG TPA: CAP domain-containing protein [Labilithrix sp.]|nr:CAP domain-containing protein [Labilithrix sp.]